MNSKIIKAIKWIFWDFSGLHMIWQKIDPPEDPNAKKPPSFTLWVIALYVSAFTLASGRFENRRDLIENRVSILMSQLSGQNWKKAIEGVPSIQKMKRPKQPDFISPLSLFESLFYPQIPDSETVEELRRVVQAYKNDLDNVFFNSIDLFDINLSDANLRNTTLWKANLELANLERANLEDADLVNANLKGANLEGANLKKANLLSADLEFADLRASDLKYAYLVDANLEMVDLEKADITLANLKGANLEGATWTNGKICKEGSIGKCIQ